MLEGLSHLTMDNVQVYFQRMEGVFVYNFCHWKYYYVLINYRFCFLSLHYTVITLTPFEHLDFPFPLNSLSSWILVWFDLYANIHYRGFQNLSQVNVRLFFKIPIDHEPSWFTCPLCAQSCAYSMTREVRFFRKVLLQIRAQLFEGRLVLNRVKFYSGFLYSFVRKPFWDHFLHSIWSIQSSNCWQKELYWIFYETFQVWNQISH